MKVFESLNDWLEFRKCLAKSLGFVPTMGAIHEGHLSLLDAAKFENESAAVSIFLNPTQFNDPKDLEKYPVSLEQDLKLLQQRGCDFVLLPKYQEIYHDDYQFKVSETRWSQILEGRARPGHFDGVLTVVLKLLNLLRADKAYFGEKDYQQFQMIQEMAQSFFLATEILSVATVRDADGLAMSSRNRLLNAQERQLAPNFFKQLSSNQSLDQIQKQLEDFGFRVDYLEEYKGRRYGAVFLGNMRLIDNIAIKDLQ